jgi:hypothetical protein
MASASAGSVTIHAAMVLADARHRQRNLSMHAIALLSPWRPSCRTMSLQVSTVGH